MNREQQTPPSPELMKALKHLAGDATPPAPPAEPPTLGEIVGTVTNVIVPLRPPALGDEGARPVFLVIDQPDHDWSHTPTVVGIYATEAEARARCRPLGRTGEVFLLRVGADVPYGAIKPWRGTTPTPGAM